MQHRFNFLSTFFRYQFNLSIIGASRCGDRACWKERSCAHWSFIRDNTRGNSCITARHTQPTLTLQQYLHINSLTAQPWQHSHDVFSSSGKLKPHKVRQVTPRLHEYIENDSHLGHRVHGTASAGLPWPRELSFKRRQGIMITVFQSYSFAKFFHRNYPIE